VRVVAVLAVGLVLAASIGLVAHRARGGGAVAVGQRSGDGAVTPASELPSTTVVPSTTTSAAPATTTTEPPAPPTTAAPPPTTTAPAPKPPAAVASAAAPAVPKPVLPVDGGAYKGLGTWVDVYDWTTTYTNGKPSVGLADIDHMAEVGVQTLYIQAARGDNDDDVVERPRLQALIKRAHDRHMAVVAWFLPYLTDPAADMRHLQAIAGLSIDGLGIDIEARNVSDVDDRNQRLIELSAAVRKMTSLPVAAIVLPPVVLEVVNPNYWPNFPWKQIAPFYDVWMPMSYWTNRTDASGYRDAYRYTTENIQRMRADLGLPTAPTHPIGGIGDETTADDVDAFQRAVSGTSSLGGSLYDYHTTADDQWSHLQHLRAG
jgi:hypothetical protein